MEADQAVEHAVLDQTNVDELRLKNGGYEFIFTHPEGACSSTKQGVALFQSDVYKRCILAVAFSVSAAQAEETLPILLFYGYFTRIVFLDRLLFDFDAFARIDCLHDPLY